MCPFTWLLLLPLSLLVGLRFGWKSGVKLFLLFGLVGLPVILLATAVVIWPAQLQSIASNAWFRILSVPLLAVLAWRWIQYVVNRRLAGDLISGQVPIFYPHALVGLVCLAGWGLVSFGPSTFSSGSLWGLSFLIMAVLYISPVFDTFEVRRNGILAKGTLLKWDAIQVIAWKNILYKDVLQIAKKRSSRPFEIRIPTEWRDQVDSYLKQTYRGSDA